MYPECVFPCSVSSHFQLSFLDEEGVVAGGMWVYEQERSWKITHFSWKVTQSGARGVKVVKG